MDMAAYWWWFIAGIILIMAEFVVPGVFICFFGVGALLTGAVVWLLPDMTLTMSLLLFSFLSVVFLVFCRRFLPRVFRGTVKVDRSDIENDDIAGAEAVVVEAVAPGVPGRVEFRGSQWTARADRAIAVGERAKIKSRKNLTLYLE
ncbi:MAG: NfeD family protein [Lentisphaeria bacterium]|nr:NfeD family protein [Lentisphaeria bacterium]